MSDLDHSLQGGRLIDLGEPLGPYDGVRLIDLHRAITRQRLQSRGSPLRGGSSVAPVAAAPVVPAAQVFDLGHIYGAQLVFLTVSTVEIGAATQTSELRDSADGSDHTFTGTLGPVDLTAAGVNGLDAGVEAANTFYAVHVIADSTGALPVAGLFSLSATAPTLPAGYDAFRRVGWVRNDAASDIHNFIQFGLAHDRTVFYVSLLFLRTILAGGSAAIWATVSAATLVPTTSLQAYCLFETAGGAQFVFISTQAGGPTQTRALVPHTVEGWLPLRGAQLFDYGFSLAGVSFLTVSVQGWKETLC